MSFNLPPIGGTGQTPPAPRNTPATKPGAAFSLPQAAEPQALPPSPPPDVLEQTYDAARVAETLRAQQRELHFEPAGDGRVVVQVRDLQGNVLRTVTPREVLEIASGAPLR